MLDLSKNYFDLFGLPVGFQLNMDELSSRYRALQKVVHPDRFASADAQSQRISLQNATLINEAYQTLKVPLERARYLLTLRGVALDDPKYTLNDPAFLMQQMELREALAAVPHSSEPLARIETLLNEIGERIQAQVAELAVLLEDVGDQHSDLAVQASQKLQFLTKLLAEAEAAEANLEEAC